MNLMIIKYIGQFTKSIGFLYLLYVLILDFFTITRIKEIEIEIKRRFLIAWS